MEEKKFLDFTEGIKSHTRQDILSALHGLSVSKLKGFWTKEQWKYWQLLDAELTRRSESSRSSLFLPGNLTR
jgi:hypothetical protein